MTTLYTIQTKLMKKSEKIYGVDYKNADKPPTYESLMDNLKYWILKTENVPIYIDTRVKGTYICHDGSDVTYHYSCLLGIEKKPTTLFEMAIYVNTLLKQINDSKKNEEAKIRKYVLATPMLYTHIKTREQRNTIDIIRYVGDGEIEANAKEIINTDKPEIKKEKNTSSPNPTRQANKAKEMEKRRKEEYKKQIAEAEKHRIELERKKKMKKSK